MRKAMGLRQYPKVVSVLGGLAVLLAIIGVVAFCSSMSRPALGQSTTVRVDSPETVSVGDVVIIAVRIEDVMNLGAYEWVLRYDPTLLDLVDPPGNPVDGPFLGSSGRSVFCLPPIVDETEGMIRFGCVTQGTMPPGPSGSGVLSYVTLTALAQGNSSLCLGYVQLADPLGSDIPSDVAHDSMAIGGASPLPPSCPPAATPTPWGTPAPTATPSSTPTPGPLPPHRFFGRVAVDGARALPGTDVTASVGGTVCGQTTVDVYSEYVVDVVSWGVTPGCGTEGATISFAVAGYQAEESATWHVGEFTDLDLTVLTGAPTATRTPTSTPSPTPTPIAFSGVIRAGASTATVLDDRVTERSHITVTLTSDPRRSVCRLGRCYAFGSAPAVSWVEPAVGEGFVVHLTGAVGQDTTFTYSIQTME